MPEPTPTAYPVRLDELINAIKRVHSDVLDQLSDAVWPPSISAKSPIT